jgi:hypothetical protein
MTATPQPITTYLPAVTVLHDPETLAVIQVDVDWSGSQQVQPNYVTSLSEASQEEASLRFDDWLSEGNQP